MQVSGYGSYQASKMLQDVSLSMVKQTSDMTAQSLDKIMSSVASQGSSAPLRPGIGQSINTYA